MGRDLAPMGIKEFLVAWDGGRAAKFKLSRGRTSFSRAWRYRRDMCWGLIGAQSWA
ncbi:hypothetical protein RHMOL_Rhmol05G0135300 [Rhododendron molle]|uniref:Uncharacterized protein n=1 Tax=Rhododendron molle TaxID=49168 RepID=A0ACC0NPW8_RHOML|nr:hypothetical protein RHMOL_Rhmol05G0135300 [Rhododendron molle]